MSNYAISTCRLSTVLLTSSFLAVCLLVSGCGHSSSTGCTVTGNVTWNGDALSDGSIVFMAADGKAAPSAGTIHDGRFKFEAQAGKMKVEIRATRERDEMDPVMKVKTREAFIPACYNAQTTLTAEVVPGGENEFTFDLKNSAH